MTDDLVHTNRLSVALRQRGPSTVHATIHQSRRDSWTLCAIASLAVWLAAACASPAAAADVFGDDLATEDAAAFVSVGQVDDLRDAWHATQYGQLVGMDDMQAFLDELTTKLTADWQNPSGIMGMTWDELSSVTDGRMAAALLPKPNGRPGRVVMIETGDRRDEAKALVEQVAAYHKSRGATVAVGASGDVATTTVTLKATAGEELAGPYIYAIREELLIIADDPYLLADVLAPAGSAGVARLAATENYKTLVAGLAAGAPPEAPHARWFVNATALARLADAEIIADRLRAGAESDAKEPGPSADHAATLAQHGLDQVVMAGEVWQTLGEFDILHRVAVHAPDRDRGVLRLASLQHAADLSPPAWLSADFNSCTMAELDVATAFEGFATLFDEFLGEGEEGVFEELVVSVRDDPNGPQVDLRGELMPRLGPKLIIVDDAVEPLSAQSERHAMLVATDNEAAAADCLERLMAGDPEVVRRTIGDSVVWEVKAQAADPDKHLPSAAVTAARGHLIVATHVELVEKLLGDAAEKMVDDKQYRRVVEAMARQPLDGAALRNFARSQEALRTTYELARADKLGDEETPLSNLIVKLLDQLAPNRKASGRIDASLLPEFKDVGQYLEPVGTQVSITSDGWLSATYVLRPE